MSKMRHRGSSKIKYEHCIIKDLRKLLEKIEPWEEIQSIIPAAIRPTKSHRPLTLDVKYTTATGVKCLARSGTAVQEVFVVTTNPDKFEQRLKSFLQTSRA